jgi:fructose-1,6-bisphosphatase I / sedoheptulose-1,7-bisphosphatase
MRWIASMVAEAHRILMRGGVFMYPRDTKDPAKPGRLRLLYEANPIGLSSSRPAAAPAPGASRCWACSPARCTSASAWCSARKNEVERIERYHHEPMPSEDANAAVRRAQPVPRLSAARPDPENDPTSSEEPHV